MKETIAGMWVIVLCLISPCAAVAAPASEAEAAARYNEAGALYRDGQFHKALEAYEQLIESGIQNPDLYYNAANAAYRAEMIGKSALYFERALKLAPSDKEARANLAFINSQKQDREPSEENAVLAFLERWYGSINTDSSALLSGTAFALMMLFAAGLIFLRGWQRIVLWIVSGLCGLAFLASTGMFVHKTHRLATVQEAVIMAPEAHAYSGPGTENTLIFTLHEGTKVIFERGQDGWLLVRLKSGIGGWIMEGSVEKI